MWYSALVSERIDDVLAEQWHDLMGRYHRVSCTLDRALQAEHGLSASDFEVLQLLHGATGDAGQRCASEAGWVQLLELGQHVHLTQSALSRQITRLEKAGLVERATCLNDRRSVQTRITEVGSSRFVEARPTQRAVLRESLSA